MRNDIDNEIDYVPILVRPLYFGLFVNVLIPMGLLFVCYYIQESNPQPNRVGEMANVLFWVLLALSLAEAVFALLWRQRLFRQPMIRSDRTFEADLRERVLAVSRPVFLVIAGMSVYGYAYFFLTGRFIESVILVLLSFLVFQMVRPRQGSLKKLVAWQRELVKRGHYRQ